MKKFEELLLKISRFFGLILMSLVLLLITILFIVVIVNKGSMLFEKSTPDVRFYKSDFIESGKEKDLSRNQIRPESEVRIIARSGAERLKPKFEEKLNAYIEKEKENLFRNSETQEKEISDFRENRIKGFVDNTESYIVNVLLYNYKEDLHKAYVYGLVDYINEADEQGVEVFTQNGTPVSTIAYSRVVNKYNQEFNSQKNEINQRSEESTGVANMIGNAALYGSILFFITIFLFISIMIAILRIENKMKG